MTGSRRDLSGHIAVISGAARGIGRSCAEVLARRGATIIAVDVSEEVLSPCGGDLPDHAWLPIVGDVTSPRTIARTVEVAHSAPGLLSVLVNSAFAEERTNLLEGTTDGWARTYEVSVLGAVALSRAMVPLMAPPAAIVNVASVHAFRARSQYGAYAAAKAALVSFTRTAAVEWGPIGIRTNGVAPAFVAVERNAHLWGDEEQRYQLARFNALDRVCQPTEVADVVAFLASDEASFVNGAVVPVDGGILAALPGPA